MHGGVMRSGSWRVLPFIVLLAVVPYLNSLDGDFVFDDADVISANPLIAGKGASALALFCAPAKLYRPVTMLTYLVNVRLGGGVVGYHLVNVALHALVTVAVFLLAWRLLESVTGATVAAALFAVHPIHTEAVSSIVGRAELLAALFALGSLLAWMWALDAPRRRVCWLMVSAIAMALGCLAKESALVAIPLCAAVYLWRAAGPPTFRWLRLLIPHVLVAVAYLPLRIWITGRIATADPPQFIDNPLAHVPLLPRLETALVVLWQYLSALTVPLRLSADYSFNEVPVVGSILEPRFLGAVVLFALLASVLALGIRRLPALLLAAAFIIISLSLTANILFPIGTIKAERLLYLPSFGWCLASGALFVAVPARRHRHAMAVIVLVIIAYAGRTWVRNRDWHDNVTLFAATVETSPHSAKAHHNLAVFTYDRQNDVDAAIAHFREALAIFPRDDRAAFGLGKMYEAKGMEDAALSWYARALELNPEFVSARLNTGAIRYRRGEYADAEGAFRAGLEMEPTNLRLLIGLSLVRLAQGRRAEAQAIVDRAAARMDGDPESAQLIAGATRMLQEAPPR